jgi:flagellar hook-associated protein 1
MAGLFDILGIAARSLQTQQTAISVTGNNLANSSNPAYARQRAVIIESMSSPSSAGLVGTGSEVETIQQIRSALLDGQIQSEGSTMGYWQQQQQALQTVQADLGQEITTSTAAGGTTTSQGISAALTDLFGSFQSLSTDPTSMAQRQVVLMQASNLAGQFNQVSQELGSLRATLNDTLQSNVTDVNGLLSDIAGLNGQISTTELQTNGTANDLRDLRQQKIEQLSSLVKVDTATQSDGTVNVSIGGELLVSGSSVTDTLQTYDAGGGQLLVQTATGGTALTLGGGSMQGIIDVRDGSLATLSSNLDTLANQLITQVNTIHDAGYSLTGSTGAKFFEGSDAGTISVNTALLNDPSLLQASGTKGVTGDNQVALQLAQLASQPLAGLGNQTLGQSYDASVATLGQALSSANGNVSDQQIVQNMLQQQRDSVSGVSIDEEMTNLMTYERAYQASAQVITVVDSLLATLMAMKQTA